MTKYKRLLKSVLTKCVYFVVHLQSTAEFQSSISTNVPRDYFQVSFRITAGTTWRAALADSSNSAYAALVTQILTYVITKNQFFLIFEIQTINLLMLVLHNYIFDSRYIVLNCNVALCTAKRNATDSRQLGRCQSIQLQVRSSDCESSKPVIVVDVVKL